MKINEEQKVQGPKNKEASRDSESSEASPGWRALSYEFKGLL